MKLFGIPHDRRFGFASENFYAEFLAALEVESHAEKIFWQSSGEPSFRL